MTLPCIKPACSCFQSRCSTTELWKQLKKCFVTIIIKLKKKYNSGKILWVNYLTLMCGCQIKCLFLKRSFYKVNMQIFFLLLLPCLEQCHNSCHRRTRYKLHLQSNCPSFQFILYTYNKIINNYKQFPISYKRALSLSIHWTKETETKETQELMLLKWYMWLLQSRKEKMLQCF